MKERFETLVVWAAFRLLRVVGWTTKLEAGNPLVRGGISRTMILFARRAQDIVDFGPGMVEVTQHAMTMPTGDHVVRVSDEQKADKPVVH